MRVHGIVLAAGAGTRMGIPKAVVVDDDGSSWLVRAVEALELGGCSAVTVVLGASAAEARELLSGRSVGVVEAEDWATGLSASLRAGLASLDAAADAALVTLVDLPDVSAAVIGRVLQGVAGRATLRRASYDGEPGHPVLIGRDHWVGVLDTSGGDRGARDYLATHAVELVECSDLATGRDQDTP